MKTINGHKYSRKEFPGYQLRLIVEITDIDDEDHIIHVYTTNTIVDNAWDDLLDIITSKVKTFSITHHATKRQDDAASKLIDEIFN